MGYQKNNYQERDREFEKSFQERGVNNVQAKKELNNLFAPKPKAVDQCEKGHAWIRDWDGVYKCVRCKTPKPIAPKPV